VEGLRAIAALSVLTYHVRLFGTRSDHSFGVADHLLAGAGYGVTLFFVLSGFLLWRPFADSLLHGRALPAVGAYARNRALRILPAYWAILLLTAFVLRTALQRYVADPGPLTSPHVLAANLLLIQGYFTSTIETGIGPAWSLCVEVVFYAVLPLLALGAARLAVGRAGSRTRVGVALAPAGVLLGMGVITLISLGANPAALSSGPRGAVIIDQSFLANADLFAFGMAAAVLVLLVQDGRLRFPRAARVSSFSLAAILAATLLAAPIGAMSPTNPTLRSSLTSGLAAGLALLACLLPDDGRPRARTPLLERRPLMLVGLCSYSVYLWHTPVIFLFDRWRIVAHGAVTYIGCLALVLATTLGLSAGTYLLVERPALRRKRTWGQPGETGSAGPDGDGARTGWAV
jgi:peptidoglycan/LPS O-acetylase OafA/YrhL